MSFNMRVAMAGAWLATPAIAGTFHPDALDMNSLKSKIELAGCVIPEALPTPHINDPFYAGLGEETTTCTNKTAAYGLLTHLTSEEATLRYQSIRYVQTRVNQWGKNEFLMKVGGLASDITKQLNFMAVLDLPYIADYARAVIDPRPSLQNQSVTGQDLSKRRIGGDLCYHTSFSQSDLSQSTWHFERVTRFCNFKDVKANGTKFRGWLYMQTFENTELEGSLFELSGAGVSEIKFINCNLKQAHIVGDLSRVTFSDSDLTGAVFNGKTCIDSRGTGCLVEN